MALASPPDGQDILRTFRNVYNGRKSLAVLVSGIRRRGVFAMAHDVPVQITAWKPAKPNVTKNFVPWSSATVWFNKPRKYSIAMYTFRLAKLSFVEGNVVTNETVKVVNVSATNVSYKSVARF